MFLALMLKDLRMLRPAIVAALIVAAFFDLVVPAFIVYQRSIRDGVPIVGVATDRMWAAVDVGATLTLTFSSGLAATFAVGGATERRERWAEVPAMLPVAGWRRSLARLSVAGALAAILCVSHAAVVAFASRRVPTNWRTVGDFRIDGYLALAGGMFAFAWLAAAFLRSAVVAAASGIGVVVGGLLLTVVVQDASYVRGLSPRYDLEYLRVIALVAPAVVAAGVVASARRVSP